VEKKQRTLTSAIYRLEEIPSVTYELSLLNIPTEFVKTIKSVKFSTKPILKPGQATICTSDFLFEMV